MINNLKYLVVLALLAILPLTGKAVAPDLTTTNLALIDTTSNYSLGPTGLRGWIYIANTGKPWSRGLDESMTDEQPYQVLVVSVGTNTPAFGILQEQDVLLGVNTGAGNIPVPLFTNDTRKAIGAAIGTAEAGDGWMNFKVWREGVVDEYSIRLPIQGLGYSATAPYNCPKSALILSNAVAVLGAKSLVNPISGLALLAAGGTNYLPKIQTYARGISSVGSGHTMWGWGYNGIFLSEYYLRTGDTNILQALSEILMHIAEGTDRYGTTCHSESFLNDDGSFNGTSRGYGPVNQVGLAVNTAMVMGRKSLLVAGRPVDPAIDAAITRGANFFGWYAHKGEIQYGEHNPFTAGSHGDNGKHGQAAFLFAMMGDRPEAAEYFTRMTLAGYIGREYGHTGQGFSYLWSGIGANMGGTNAMASYISNIKWHLDLERRSDGSFVYDGAEQFGASPAADYWTYTSYQGFVDPTASYILTYAAPLKQIYMTGKDANPTNILSPDKVTNALWSAMMYTNVTLMTTNQLIAGLGEYDPTVRWWVAEELGKRPGLNASSITNLLGSTNAWIRAAACITLGALKDTNTLMVLSQCLNDTNVAVRAHAGIALKRFGASASPLIPSLLTTLVNNSADPNVIDWNDPFQSVSAIMGEVLFGGWIVTMQQNSDGLVPFTASADRNLLLPALRKAMIHPDSLGRGTGAGFVYSRCAFDDIKALVPDLIQCATTPVLADPMWRANGRDSSIRALGKFYCPEAVTLGLRMLYQPWVAEGKGDAGDSESQNRALNVIASFGDAVRWTLPTLNNYVYQWGSSDGRFDTLVSAINTITVATNAPVMTNLFPVAVSQVVVTTNTAAITLAGYSCRTNVVTFQNVTSPLHGLLTGTPPNLTYTVTPGYSGLDRFTFQVSDQLTNSEPATVSIIIGTAGTGIQGTYFDNMDFTSQKVSRVDSRINFDWGTSYPTNTMGVDTFSVQWSGSLLIPETGNYMFSTLNSDGVRLYVDGQLVIDDWNDHDRFWNDGTPIALTEGQQVNVWMGFYENTGNATAKLKWSGPSFGGSNGVIVGTQWLGAQLLNVGVTNTPVYAYAQSVTLPQNTNTLIILNGSYTNFVNVTQPSNGTLTGTPPRVTYTPSANYVGGDSFTFQVTDGATVSAPATVSINVLYGNPISYFWTNLVGGVWSTAGNWTNTLKTVAAPLPDGLPNYILNFKKAGTYGVTNDLNSGILVNQVNFGATLTLVGNTICTTNNGLTLPEINQTSTYDATINTPLSLGATTTLGGIGSGQVIINNLISGQGGLIVDSPGNLILNNTTNTYSGGTVINNGTVSGPGGNGSQTPIFGTGPITFNPSSGYSFNRHLLTNSITLNGPTLSGGNSFGTVFTGPVTLSGITTISLGTTGGFGISGNVSGQGGFKTIGTTAWGLSGTNTYTGPTLINAGGIQYTTSLSVAPGALIIKTNAYANLNYTGNRNIAWLTLNDVDQSAGTYGSTNSTATYKSSYFKGNGTVTVTFGGGGITNQPASQVQPTSATLNATLIGGGIPYTVIAYWNTSNGGTNELAWTNSVVVGTWTIPGSSNVSWYVSGLLENTPYFYTFRATNAFQNIWASNVQTFNIPATTSLGASSASGTYGQTVTFTATVSVLTNGPATRTVTFMDGVSTLATVDLNGSGVATYQNNNLSAGSHSITANYSGDSQFPSSSSSPVSYTVIPKSVTITGVSANNKVYNKATDAVLSGGTVSGIVNGDTVTAVLGMGIFSSPDVGTRSVMATGCSLGGSKAGNYSLSAQPNPGSATINPKGVTITGVTATDKVYDGTTAAVITGGSVSGVISGDTVTPVLGQGNFASPNAGTWAVATTNCSLGGASAGNYTLSSQPSAGSATITTREALLGGGRPYNGTNTITGPEISVINSVDGTNLTVTGTATITAKEVGSRQLVTGVSTPVRVQSATGSTPGVAAGSNTVTLSTSPLEGNTLIAVISTRGLSANQVTGITQAGVTWTRAAQSVNINGTTAEIWYGPAGPSAGKLVTINQVTNYSAAVVMEYSGILLANPVDQIASNSGRSTTASTGTTPTTTQAKELWIGGLSIADGRYTLSAIANGFTTVASPKSGSGSGDSIIYALEKIVTATGTASTSGTLTRDQWSGVIVTFKAGLGSTLALTGPAAANYKLNEATGTVTITTKQLAVSGLTASNKVYNATTNATWSGTPALLTAETPGTGTTSDGKPFSGDTVSLSGTVSCAFTNKDVGSGKTLTISGLSLTGAQSANYSVAQPTNLTANITAKALTVTGVTVTTRVYNATTNATFSAGGLQTAEAPGTGTSVDGKPYTGDTVGTALSGYFAAKNVGSGITVNTLASLTGAQAGNYTLTQPTGITGTITTVPLTVTANNQSKSYGQTLTFGSGSTQFTSSGLIAGETIGTVTLACSGGAAGATIGTYPITPSAATGGTFLPSNYSITYNNGTLTVGSTSQTITFNALPAKTYGNAPFALTATASSGLTVSYASSDTNVATVAGSTITILKAGTSTITATQAGDANYAAAIPVDQILTVNAASQTITFNALPVKAYGDEPFALTGSASSGLEVSYSSSDTSVATVVTNVVTILKAGATTITASQAGNTNYTAATSVPQTLTVNAATQTIIFASLAVRTYGDVPFALTAAASSGLPVSYTSSDTNVATVAGATVTILNAGVTTITATQAGDTNTVAATPVPQTLTVNKALPVIIWNSPATISLGTALSSLQLNATSGGVAGTFVYTPPAGTVLPLGEEQVLRVSFTPTDTDNYSTPADLEVFISVSPIILAEDFEDDWADNALARSTNGWSSTGLSDQSSITNPAVGYGRLPHNVLFPLLYNHASSRRILKLDTQSDVLKTPTVNAEFVTAKIYVDMMAKFGVCEAYPGAVSNNLTTKASVFLLANGGTTNLVVFHGKRETQNSFGAPTFTPVLTGFDSSAWYRLTLIFDATTNGTGAEAFSVRINGEPLVSSAAYGDTWKTRIFSGSFQPDGGMWFLSATRRQGGSSTNLTTLTGLTFEGAGFVDDLVVTATPPTFTPGTLIILAMSTGNTGMLEGWDSPALECWNVGTLEESPQGGTADRRPSGRSDRPPPCPMFIGHDTD
jgi:autotransporter-associated beta strand protein